jgi:hypothetical protein
VAADAKICQQTGHAEIYAVTPFGYWQFANMTAVNNYAFKWGLPMSGGNATIDVVNSIDWFGPSLDDLVKNTDPALAPGNQDLKNEHHALDLKLDQILEAVETEEP